ncbi:MAG TPA: NUDIX hydrolase [Clostridia bacterium]|nr:NUDIX hydrolase [Clostridia bacterium]
MGNYIMDLRKLVGHRPLLQCGASVIVENEKGELLLQLRADNGCWAYSGGSVEPDEEVMEAARRELFEETGLNALSLTLYGVFSGADMHYIYPNGDEVSNIDIVYVCKSYRGTLSPQAGEVKELRFFPPESLPQNLSPPNARALRQYVSERLHAKTDIDAAQR